MADADDFDKTRTTTGPESEYDIDSSASEVQRGIFPTPQFFGDNSITSAFQTFQTAVSKASTYAGAALILRNDLVEERDPAVAFRLTEEEFVELSKKAASISAYGNIPFDVAEDFLIILCFVDKFNDMQTIADAVQIPELANPDILRKPFEILAIPLLEKVAFCASAVEGLINLFRRYLGAAQYTPGKSGQDVGDILSNLGILASGFGGMGASLKLSSGGAEDALGQFMSELITGKRIPMSVIAKNPNLQSPSYTGKAFFGEAPTALNNIDIDSLFAKKIGAFPQPSNGSGTTSFGLQNMKSFTNSMSVSGLVSKMLTGSELFTEGTKKARQIESVVDQLNTMTGATGSDIVDIRRADTAIPMMSALSAIGSGSTKSAFGTDTYKSGWMLSNSVSNHLQNNNSPFFEAVKRYL